MWLKIVWDILAQILPVCPPLSEHKLKDINKYRQKVKQLKYYHGLLVGNHDSIWCCKNTMYKPTVVGLIITGCPLVQIKSVIYQRRKSSCSTPVSYKVSSKCEMSISVLVSWRLTPDKVIAVFYIFTSPLLERLLPCSLDTKWVHQNVNQNIMLHTVFSLCLGSVTFCVMRLWSPITHQTLLGCTHKHTCTVFCYTKSRIERINDFMHCWSSVIFSSHY